MKPVPASVDMAHQRFLRHLVMSRATMLENLISSGPPARHDIQCKEVRQRQDNRLHPRRFPAGCEEKSKARHRHQLDRLRPRRRCLPLPRR